MKKLISRGALVAVLAASLVGPSVPAFAADDLNSLVAATNDAAADAGLPAEATVATKLQGDAFVTTVGATRGEVDAARRAGAAEAQAALKNQTTISTADKKFMVDFVAETAAAAVQNDLKVSLPVDPDGAITLADSSGAASAVSIGLPTGQDRGDAERARTGEIVYQDKAGSVDLVAKPTEDGARLQTILNGPSAPTRYTYRMTLPANATASIGTDGGVHVVQATTLLDAGGAVTGTENIEIASIAPAWATDAEGMPVPTHYELHGADLVQVVEHTSGHYAYPVTADPSITKILKCAAAIAYVALTVAFLAGKSIAVVRGIMAARVWVNEVGGVRAAAQLLVGATNAAEKTKLISSMRSIAGTAILDFLGVTAIREGCF